MSSTRIGRHTIAQPFGFTPSQGLPVALSQYAPGKEVWIDSKLWMSGAVYSPIPSDRYQAWQNRRLYYECRDCHYALTTSLENGGSRRDEGLRRVWRYRHVRSGDKLAASARLCAPGEQGGGHFTGRSARAELCHTCQIDDAYSLRSGRMDEGERFSPYSPCAALLARHEPWAT